MEKTNRFLRIYKKYFQKKSVPPSSLCFCFKQDYDVIKSPTRLDHSYDKSLEKKEPTLRSHSFAPVKKQPKIPTALDHSLAGEKPKKPVSAVNTGALKKPPTEVDTRALVSQGQGVNMKQDIEETINIMREYMANIEQGAAQQQLQEKLEREREVERLIEKYGSKAQASPATDLDRKKVIEDLLLTYGKKNKERQRDIHTENTIRSKIFQSVVQIKPRTPRKETAENAKETETVMIQQFNKKSSRPRPTSLHLILN